MKYLGQFIQHFDSTFRQNVTVEGNLTLNRELNFDGIGLTGVQTSAESFSNDDISLMTSAAIEDKILSYGYTTNTGDISFNLGGVNNYMVTASSSNTIQGEQYIQAFTASNVTRMNLFSNEDTGDNLQIAVTTHGATSFTTTDDDGAAAHFEIDADGDIILDAAGTIKLEGPVRPTGQIHIKQGSFTVDAGTDRIYFPMAGSTENTASVGITIPFLAPVGGKLLKIHWRTNQNHSGQTTTFALLNWDSNEAFTTGNATDLGTKAVTPANQNNVTTIDFQTGVTGTNAFTAGETLAISMQNSSAVNAGSNTKYWFTAVFEFDFSSY